MRSPATGHPRPRRLHRGATRLDAKTYCSCRRYCKSFVQRSMPGEWSKRCSCAKDRLRTVLSVLFFSFPLSSPSWSASMEFRSAPTPFGAVLLVTAAYNTVTTSFDKPFPHAYIWVCSLTAPTVPCRNAPHQASRQSVVPAEEVALPLPVLSSLTSSLSRLSAVFLRLQANLMDRHHLCKRCPVRPT